MRAIEGYRGQPATCAALRLLPLVVTRPGELRAARWAEFDLEGATPLWSIPAERMKMRAPHVVPLSRQALAILKDLKPLTYRGPDSYAFPSNRGASRPLSENTINAALRGLGYDTATVHTAHGFRASFSTVANELGWSPDVIERCLAHQERDAVRKAYNRAGLLEQRRALLQQWADHLEHLRVGTVSKVVHLESRRRVEGAR
jgi:integrase